jgi:N-acetylmuramoyl-L-alanine amidase CwlA
MKNFRLNETTIGTAKVIIDILPKGKVIPNTKITPTSITIHQTGNIGASAKANHNYQKNCNKNGNRVASWHFTIDDKEIYQAQSTNYKCYHAGCSNGNNTSIGIEICMFNDPERQKKAYLNAIELVKVLMAYHKFDISKVKRHYDWTKKDCPQWLIANKFGYNWNWFKQQCEGKVNEFKPYVVKIIVDELNVRKGAGTSYDIVTSVKQGQAFTIVEEKNGWGLLKSKVGWINLNTKYVKKI